MPNETGQKTLYIFIDESGNFDFTPTGTKYFALTAVSTLVPLKDRVNLLGLRYNLLDKGFDQECFHATEDKQEVRDLVYQELKKLDDFEVDAIIAQKNKANPSLYTQLDTRSDIRIVRSEERFYDKISQLLLQYIFRRHEDKDSIDRIVVVLGSLFTKKKRGYILKSLKQYLKTNFKKPFYIYFHSTAADINCQIADYCGWAVYVIAERNEKRPWAEIKDKIKSHFDVFARGTTVYYEYP